MSKGRKTTRDHYKAREIVSVAPSRQQVMRANKRALDDIQAGMRPIRPSKVRTKKTGNPLEGVAFAAQWTIGNNTTRWGYSQGNYGALVPDFIQGIQVDTFRTSSGDLLKVDLVGQVQIPTLGAGSVNLYLEGYPNNPVLLTWDPSELFYSSVTDPVLEQWVIDNDGNTIGVEGFPLNVGTELIVNGTFNTDLSGWNDNGGLITWNAGGWAERLALGTGNFTQNNIPNLVQGATYRVSVTAGDVVGQSTIMLGHTVATGTTLPEGSGTWTGDVVCGFEDFDMTIRTQNGTFSKVDNVSVRDLP